MRSTLGQSDLALEATGSLDIKNAPEGFQARLLSELVRQAGRSAVFIAKDDRKLAAVREALKFFDPAARTLSFPAWDCPPYSRVSPNPEIMSSRVSSLAETARCIGDRPHVLLTTAKAVMHRVPELGFVLDQCQEITSGHRGNYQQFITFLEDVGYVNSVRVGMPGEFAVRGGIIDVFPPGFRHPVRFDYFGDLVDGIRSFDQSSQRTIKRLESVRIDMLSDVVLNPDSIKRFRRNFRAEFGVAGGPDEIYSSISSGIRVQGIEHWLPFFHETLGTVFDYLPEAIVCLGEGVERQVELHWETILDSYDRRKEAVERSSFASGVSHPCRPETLYLEPGELDALLKGFQVRRFHTGECPVRERLLDAGGRKGRNFSLERQRREKPLINAIADYLKSVIRSTPVVIACWSKGSRERLSMMLADVGVSTTFTDNVRALQSDHNTVWLTVWSLSEGFVSPELTAVSEQDLFGQRLVHRTRQRARDHLLRNEVSSLVPGDPVVHIEHGIGRFVGLETIEAANSTHDCVVLEYQKGDRLYLPTVNINLLSRYGSEEVQLDRLGGVHWQERKARLKRQVLQLAERLLSIEAKRRTQTAARMSVDREYWDDFLARFQFVETVDQKTAADEVVEDLASGQPMDRLICGDVGFGKTEVAMRACFIAAMAGYQVAVIAPTTLLVRQHYSNFLSRFKNYPLKVEQLSRMVSSKQATSVKEGLKDGHIDIVIGTHALLGKSIAFRNLGLVVIDEEHAFGVLQKERLKEIRESSHVLALTATPIPRTLKLALSGAKDLSLISTPPADRLAIRTFVLEFDPVTIREALLREKFRNGQCLFIVPRIGDIPEFEAFLTDHVPEVSFVSAHGRLGTRELEDRTSAFYDGAVDVLLSTTIVAAGLDIPTANTIVIAHANKFGLAQLYQIRGRVGRSRLRAYAYVTYMRQSRLSEHAVERMDVLRTTDSLGAGFSVAAQDMDIRGAGNLLGPEQSGHVREVGFDLYQKMLEAAIASLREGAAGEPAIVEDDWEPQLNLGVSALIPSSYVSSLELRLGLYRRLSTLSEQEELEGMAAELIDRFGELPEQVQLLLEILKIKHACKTANIARLDAGPRGVTIRFRKDEFTNPDALFAYVSGQHGRAQLSGPKLLIRRNWRNRESRVAGSFVIARDIAGLANR